MADFSIRAGDRNPVLVATLKNEDGSAVDLTNATTAVLRMRRRDSTTLAIAAGAMTFATPRTLGKATYAWALADTQVADIGAYWADVLITWNDGTTQSFPMPDFLSIEIVGDLASFPAISDEDLAAIRSKIGSNSPPTDWDLARSLERLGSADAVALEVLRQRRADLLRSPVVYSVEGDYSQNASENLKALEAAIGETEGAVSTTGGTLTIGSITRSDRLR